LEALLVESNKMWCNTARAGRIFAAVEAFAIDTRRSYNCVR